MILIKKAKQPGHLFWVNENKRNSTLESFKELIDEVYFMDIEGVTIFSGLKPDKKDI